MLDDLREIFKPIYVKKGDKYITDDYSLLDGSYVLIDEQGNIKNVYEVDKKNYDKTDDMYYYYTERDYLSKLIDMNKPIDSNKIIHSNNYLSFFVKKENVNTKLNNKVIDDYYNVLINPKEKYKDKEKRKMYLAEELKYGKTSQEVIEKNKYIIKSKISEIYNLVKKDKNYLKIFFEEDIEKYKKENEKYLIPNIYNSTQYNIQIDNTTFGLPNDNMGLNAKKPYLENKSRKNTIPYLISIEEVLIQKKFFDFLMNNVSQGKNNIYAKEGSIKAIPDSETFEDDFSGYFLRLKKGKEVEIQDFDIITGFRFKLKDMEIDMVVPIDYKNSKENLKYGKIENIRDVKNFVNEIFFNKFLTGNYFSEAADIKLNDFRVKENLLKSRNSFFSWFYKGDSTIIKSSFNKISLELIKNSICNEYMNKAKEQFNLRCGILEYFGGAKKMAEILSRMSESLREKINASKTCNIDNDDEYYFAVGQCVSYFISLNKSGKKMHSLINPILNCKTDDRLKEYLIRFFKKYSYAIKKDSKRFNNLYSMILGYETKEKVNEEILIAGYLYTSLIYETKKEEEN